MPKKEKEVSEVTNSQILEALSGFGSEIKKLNDRVDAITTSSPKTAAAQGASLDVTATETSKAKPVEASEFEINGVAVSDTNPIPSEYREAVERTLNREFGIRLVPIKDSPAFQFIILVPAKYSNASPSHLSMYKHDMRPKVVTFAEGTNGVRDWCEAVYKNLPAETQAQIVADRNK